MAAVVTRRRPPVCSEYAATPHPPRVGVNGDARMESP